MGSHYTEIGIRGYHDGIHGCIGYGDTGIGIAWDTWDTRVGIRDTWDTGYGDTWICGYNFFFKGSTKLSRLHTKK